MEWLWTWEGKSFGYRINNELRTQNGRHVGNFHGDEVYGSDGGYLGEVVNSRLITNRSKKNRSKSPFSPRIKNVGQVGRVNYVGNVMLAGYEEFPLQDDL